MTSHCVESRRCVHSALVRPVGSGSFSQTKRDFADASSSARFARAVQFSATSNAAIRMAVDVPAKTVKELRDRTGAGMMDCRRALVETNCNVDAAAEVLRKKGITTAAKKSSRVANDGVVASYIHHNKRIGVLMEVNCETDFVSRREEFRTMVDNLCMQVAAFENIKYIQREDVPQEMLDNEKRIESEREDLADKPEKVREKIVEGRLDKLVKEMCLMEQPYMLETSQTVREYIQGVIVLTGENIQVRRFARYALGE